MFDSDLELEVGAAGDQERKQRAEGDSYPLGDTHLASPLSNRVPVGPVLLVLR